MSWVLTRRCGSLSAAPSPQAHSVRPSSLPIVFTLGRLALICESRISRDYCRSKADARWKWSIHRSARRRDSPAPRRPRDCFRGNTTIERAGGAVAFVAMIEGPFATKKYHALAAIADKQGGDRQSQRRWGRTLLPLGRVLLSPSPASPPPACRLATNRLRIGSAMFFSRVGRGRSTARSSRRLTWREGVLGETDRARLGDGLHSRAAMLTPSPIRSPSDSSTMSPRWMPIRKSMRCVGEDAGVAFAHRRVGPRSRNGSRRRRCGTRREPHRRGASPRGRYWLATVGSRRSCAGTASRASVRSSSALARRLRADDVGGQDRR